MLAHGATNSLSARSWCDHERRIRNVRPERWLIRSQNVSADNAPIVPHNVSMRIGSKPISQCLLATHFRVEGVRVTRSNYSMKNIPDRIVIRFCCLMNFQHWRSLSESLSLLELMNARKSTHATSFIVSEK